MASLATSSNQVSIVSFRERPTNPPASLAIAVVTFSSTSFRSACSKIRWVGTWLRATGAKASREKMAALAQSQADQQNSLIEEAKKRRSNEESSAKNAANQKAARDKQRAQASGAQGRASTILTSPLGVVGGGATGGGKTLLGV